MVKVNYPDGKVLNFAKIDNKYGYFFRRGRTYKYRLPKNFKVSK